MSERPPNAEDFPTAALLKWYRQNQRELPFRPTAKRKANPYHVLVSEAMAQQTQIATVVPYFLRFVAAFPTVQDLAAADEQRVLSLWQGLGYYRRARNLHAAAKMIVGSFDGRVPATVDELLQLPGVGRYTAGAVASVAYNTPAPIVDGNVARVFARYFLIQDPIDQPATLKTLWQLATALVESLAPTRKPAAAQRPRGSADANTSRGGPRDFNQAVMELGALVCTPKSAKCLYCPLQESCAALAAGCVGELPVKTPKKKPLAVTHTVVAVSRGDKFLFEQRPATGLWSNMWQLPTLENDPAVASATTQTTPRTRGADTAAAEQFSSYIHERFGLTVTVPQPVAQFTHQTTHRTIRFEVYRSEAQAGRLRANSGTWRSLQRLGDLPLAKPQLMAVEHLRAENRPSGGPPRPGGV